jgi:hypothetical protein
LRLLVDCGEHLFTSDLVFGSASCFSNAALNSSFCAAFAILGRVVSIFFSAK